MDPILTAPWQQLGALGSVIVALAGVCALQWRHIKMQAASHLADVKHYASQYADLLMENSKTQTALAHAIERLGERLH